MPNRDPAFAHDPRRRIFTRMTGAGPKPYRPVILAFCLAVLLASGTVSAVALWSQSATMTMQVKAGTLPSPQVQCSDVPNQTAVLVTWTPQRAGVTGYDVTVTTGTGQTTKSSSYAPTVTSEKITPPAIGLGPYTYTVTVTAKYGSWQAAPSAWTVQGTVTVVGILATISCS